MSKTGLFIHVYHQDALNWSELTWGNPQTDTHGTLPTLASKMLDIPTDEEVVSLVCEGPSELNGVREGTATKALLSERMGQLATFPRIGKKLERMDTASRDVFYQRLGGLTVGPEISNTSQEMAAAALFFNEQSADRVVQIPVATHAARAAKEQGIAHAVGLIPKGQEWSLIMADSNFANARPSDVVVAEPPHRGDDPALGHELSWPATIARYYKLETPAKLQVLHALDLFMNEAENGGS